MLVTVEKAKTFEECLQDIIQRSGIQEWAPSDDDWERREALVARARVEPLGSHQLFAQIVLGEPRVSDEVPVKDLFYNCSNSRDLVWYDSAAGVWNEAQGGNGSVLLKDYITKVLQRRLTTYSCRRSSCFHLDELRWDFGNKSFRDGVEACLRSQLPAPANFTLDPESSRRHLNFCGTVWDRELETFVPSCPVMLISRTTGWVYSGYDNPGKDTLDHGQEGSGRDRS